MTPERFTIVSFHAHPDDEALLTAGTLARAVAEGHRVVIVVATAGGAGLTSTAWVGDRLGRRRTAELRASAAAIGAARVEVLGYPDSGLDSRPAGPTPFSELAVEPLAIELAEILREESADVLTGYDARGGYGHPDHVQVHRVAARAAELAGTPILLEATVDRTLLAWAVSVLRRASRVAPMPELPDMANAFAPRSAITHRVDVRAQWAAKHASLRAHTSQTVGDDGGVRTLALLLRLPRPLSRLVLAHEWFIEVGRPAGRRKLDDVFASVRTRPFRGQDPCRSDVPR
jgi:LmbE family N-acetylglucosaminyl deacetylase